MHHSEINYFLKSQNAELKSSTLITTIALRPCGVNQLGNSLYTFVFSQLSFMTAWKSTTGQNKITVLNGHKVVFSQKPPFRLEDGRSFEFMHSV